MDGVEHSGSFKISLITLAWLLQSPDDELNPTPNPNAVTELINALSKLKHVKNPVYNGPVGLDVGVAVGVAVGMLVGIGLGLKLGLQLGLVVVGTAEGENVLPNSVGVLVGFCVCESDGDVVGSAVGVALGTAVGTTVRLAVGRNVGTYVRHWVTAVG